MELNKKNLQAAIKEHKSLRKIESLKIFDACLSTIAKAARSFELKSKGKAGRPKKY